MLPCEQAAAGATEFAADASSVIDRARTADEVREFRTELGHEGRIGLRHMYTRSARYKNFRVSTLRP
jgi:hypothetical protein